MILPNTCSALHNIQDKFYYNGIEINKRNFDITEFSIVCDKINDIKEQIYLEPNISKINSEVYAAIDLNKEIDIICKYDKSTLYLGLYNNIKRNIIPLTKDMVKEVNDRKIYHLSHEIDKTAKFILRGNIQNTIIKDKQMLWIFDNYINNIKQLSNSFQHIYELEFINGYKDYILTNEQLKQSIIER